MKYLSKDLLTLNRLLPKGATSLLLPLLHRPPGVHIHMVAPRKNILGNYCYHPIQQHRITLNNNLSPYPLLLTLLHELAHYFTYVTYSHKVAPHGKEWKNTFHQLLTPFLSQHIFPEALHQHLLHTSSHNLRAQAGTDQKLYQLLHEHNPPSTTSSYYIQELPIGTHFHIYVAQRKRTYTENAIYRLDEKRRTRYKAHNLQSGRDYLFSAICKVCPIVLPQ